MLLSKTRLWVFLFTLLLVSSTARPDVPPKASAAEQTRQAFLKVIDRPRVELAPEEHVLSTEAGITQIHFSYRSEANERVPGILLVKEEIAHQAARHPTAVVLHGTGGKKEGELPILKRLANAGFIAVSIDGRFHGERGNPAGYNAAIAKAFSQGGAHPLYYDTVWDVLRLIDYLQSRSDVDLQRIGLMGISKGGIETWLAAAADTRIAVAIPCISLQSFEWGLENDGWHGRVGTVKAAFEAASKSEGIETPDAAFVRRFYDRVIPGIHDQFDAPRMLTLIAPRPLLAISGETDPINPLPGVRLCEQAATAAYERAGARERFELIVEPKAGHTVTADSQNAAIAWFTRWLGQGRDGRQADR